MTNNGDVVKDSMNGDVPSQKGHLKTQKISNCEINDDYFSGGEMVFFDPTTIEENSIEDAKLGGSNETIPRQDSRNFTLQTSKDPATIEVQKD